jgi:hypothetical protein
MQALSVGTTVAKYSQCVVGDVSGSAAAAAVVYLRTSPQVTCRLSVLVQPSLKHESVACSQHGFPLPPLTLISKSEHKCYLLAEFGSIKKHMHIHAATGISVPCEICTLHNVCNKFERLLLINFE